jgi:hypothetical protein
LHTTVVGRTRPRLDPEPRAIPPEGGSRRPDARPVPGRPRRHHAR